MSVASLGRRVIAAIPVALGVVLLVPATLVVLGGFLPNMPLGVGRFGGLVIAYLPWVDLLALAAVLLGVLGRRLARGRLPGVLLVAAALTLGGAGLMTGQLLWFAREHGVDYSLTRALTPEGVPALAPEARLRYATVDGVDLHADIWQPPAGAPTAPATGRAAVLYIHGGGFSGGALGDRPVLFAALATDGYVVVDVEYRLSPPPRWDQAPGDAMCALGWLQAKASGFGADPTRIVIVGESAGGNLALMAAYGAGTDQLRSSCSVTPTPPAGVVAIAPTADLEGIWQDRTLEVDGKPFPESYIGGTPTDYPDRYQAASPFRLIRAGLPPTLLITGAIDRLVHLDRVKELADALKGAGAESSLVVVPYADHGLPGATNGFGEQLLEAILPAFIEAHT